ncbi:vesicle transport protein USE1-like [Physella acuta]|uniref:vesicle transport protein USE1-like n=1 Tax=Physella acuta TaxID=109671 RepID=UPI0027DB5A7D|nr:vesicle transport protein USE1-like [Physella acuta]
MADDKENRDWRFEKYIGALQNLLSEVRKSQSKPSQETLLEYQKKVDLLKGLAEAEKQPCVAERSFITDKLKPVSISSPSARQLQVKAKSKCEQDVRDELLGRSRSDNSAVVKSGHKPASEEDDLNTIMHHHHRLQEKLAEELLFHTQALGRNISDAGRVVREDTKKIAESTQLADVNMSKLKVESERLEAHTKTCSWWIWVMLVLVMVTFVCMVLFMRIFSK